MESNFNPKSKSITDNGNTSNASAGSVDADDGEEAQDEEPSSGSRRGFRHELENFRRQWQREIEVSPASDIEKSDRNLAEQSREGSNESDVALNIEEQARSLFLCGVQAERSGLLEKAISFYRRAVQLVPDIEFRVAEYSNDHTSNSYSDDSDDSSDKENIPFDDSDHDEPVNLVEKFQRELYRMGTSRICQPNVEQNGFHISSLPPEIFNYILKWVVSNDLDVLSLEQISKVCRGFYLCARDSEIWKLVCMRTWGGNIGSPNRYGSWRNMFVQRPHLSYNGAYISKTTYVRHGESTFCDVNYRPYYVVEYFRYLRFFPEGLVLMLTTPDDPHQSLAKLRFRRSKYQGVLFGRFKLVGNTLVAALKKSKTDFSSTTLNYYRYRRQRQANLQEACDQTFHVELELKNVKKRMNFQLIWKRYSIHMVYRNGQETVSEFDLTPSNFPPFMFSRVRSYTAESENPLK